MPGSFLNLQELRTRLSDREFVAANAFPIMQRLCSMCGNEDEQETLQDLVLRLLEHRESLNGCGQILSSLVREVGLFPFLEPDELSFADRIAYEFHKPSNMSEVGIVFHRPQAHVYRELMNGRSIVLSAPTSFGKSLIIDAVVASQKFDNILIIVPTLALIDETRRRLASFGTTYKIITHPFQQAASRNIFVFTQERVLELENLDRVDFFVIDEFYKLAPNRDGEGRAALLNQAFYKLARKGRQFYMLGPNITGITEGLEARLECTFLHEQYNTVASELHYVKREGNDLDTLANLCKSLDGPTIIFCQSPHRAADITKALIERGVGQPQADLDDAVNWIGQQYHPEWHIVRALAHGIGVHHGRIPRALAQFVVRAFDAGSLKFLVCTSTLIEGVNTKAENIIIFDNKINKRKYDYFTFNNIRGRSGRMFKHFVGHVYLFHVPPAEELPLVDIQAFSQSDDTPESLLMQLDEDDLTATSRDRLKEYQEQTVLSYATLKANNGIEPKDQINAAKAILNDLRKYQPLLRWSQFPTYPELETVCSLIWDNFNGQSLGGSSVRSARQLATRINNLRNSPTTASLIQQHLEYDPNPDNAVSNVLDFIKLWATFHFPRLLRTLDRIQQDVFSRKNLPVGDYNLFASRVESLFLDPTLIALEEYGIPLELARKLSNVLQPAGDLDEVLRRVKSLDIARLNVTSFEAALLADAQQHMTIT